MATKLKEKKTLSSKEKDLQKEAGKMAKLINESGYRQDYIAEKIGASSATISRFMQAAESNFVGKNSGYITQSLIDRLKVFFNV